jgi:hypothetical protein
VVQGHADTIGRRPCDGVLVRHALLDADGLIGGDTMAAPGQGLGRGDDGWVAELGSSLDQGLKSRGGNPIVVSEQESHHGLRFSTFLGHNAGNRNRESGIRNQE